MTTNYGIAKSLSSDVSVSFKTLTNLSCLNRYQVVPGSFKIKSSSRIFVADDTYAIFDRIKRSILLKKV